MFRPGLQCGRRRKRVRFPTRQRLMKMKIPRALIGSAAFALTGAWARADIPPVRIEVPRYMGTWRVLGCMENPLEIQFADASESYALTDENCLNVVFSWREHSLSAPRQSH